MFVTPDGTVTVQETSVVNITCVYDANPPDVTEIVWYKNGNRIQRDTTQRLETRHPLSAVLALYNVSRHDSGTYTCHVRNAFGKGNSTSMAVLNVLCKLIFTFCLKKYFNKCLKLIILYKRNFLF